MASATPRLSAANRGWEMESRDLYAGGLPMVLSDEAAVSMRDAFGDAAAAAATQGNGNNSSDEWMSSGDFSELSIVQLAQWRELQREIMKNWSNLHSIDDEEYDILRRPAWRGLIMALFITVILIGMIGNSIVVFVVVKNRKMQTVTNIFIANLALSDIGLCLFSLPIQLYYQLTDHWIFGETLCKVIFAAFAVPMYVSTLTILLIAFDRYWLILYPLRDRISTTKALILIGIIIIVSVLFSIPVIWFTSLHELDNPDLRIYRHYCVEKWPTPVGRKVYSASMFLLQFCLPICMTALLYYKIYCRLKNRPSHRSSNNNDRKQKTNKILFAIVSLFVICWLPWNMFSLLTEIDHGIVLGSHYKFVDLLLKVFAMSSSCINPFFYCWLNDNFRKELDQIAIKMKLYRGERPSLRSNTAHPNIQPMLNGGGGGMDSDGNFVRGHTELQRAMTMDVITADMSTSRMSITRMSTTRFSTGSALDLATTIPSPSSRRCSQNSQPRNSIVSQPRNSIVSQPRNSIVQQKGFGNFLTVPL